MQQQTLKIGTGTYTFIYVPKIYVKNEVEIESGTGYNLIKRYISNKKFEGFHCHPAFMENGVGATVFW